MRGNEVVSIRGDREDVHSHGFICPKAHGLKALHEDPDRLRTPLIRSADGGFREASWDEAFEEIDRRLTPILGDMCCNMFQVIRCIRVQRIRIRSRFVFQFGQPPRRRYCRMPP